MRYKTKHKTNTTMGILKKIKEICKHVQIVCIGNRMRKQIFLEKLLVRANRHWFGFSESVMKKMCKALALAIPGDCMAVSNISFDQFKYFQGNAAYMSKKSKECNLILIDILRVTPVGYQTFRVELITKNLDYDRDNPESEKCKVRLSYEVKIPYEEIETDLFEFWIRFKVCRLIFNLHIFCFINLEYNREWFLLLIKNNA